MAYTVQMPALGESVTEGTVTRWLKQEGDHVDVDEPLLEVSTDKVDTEIPSPQAGVLQRIVAQEDDTVEVGGDLAVIGDEGEGGGSSGGDAQPAQESQSEPEPEPQQESEPEPEPQQQSEPEPQPAAAASSGGSSGGASTTVEMPALGESVTEGTVTRWLKQVGDTVEVDEPLLEVSTDKVDTEIPSPVAGTVLELRAGEDDTVEVGGALAVIGDASQASGGGSPAPTQQEPQQAEAQQAESAPPREDPRPEPERPAEPEPAQAPAGAQAASGADDYVSHETEQPTGPSGPANAGAQKAPSQASTQGNGASAPAGDEASGSPYVTPLVRKLAAERGVDLSSLTGTGVGGRIRKQDVVKAADEQDSAAATPAGDAPAAAQASGGSGGGAVHGGEVQKPSASGSRGSSGAPAPDTSGLRGTTQKLSRRRATIAKRMVESLQISAQLTTVVEADLTRIARLRDRAKADFQKREGVKLSFLPFMALATVEALKAHPQVNAMIDTEKGEVTYHGAEHLGIAVDSPAGLIVPVVHDAGDLNLAGLARKISDVADRTRANKITPDELSGGTFTITNTGSRGALIDTPIINQPQVGILGTGAVVKKPVVLQDDSGGDVIAIRSTAYLCLSYDHRIVDGADAARFLTTIKDRLEGGAFEGELGL
ncbi:2-oxoglutarate dehydrogenase, E2 component, dihydrolipoamide succinyltransferase [Actinomycetospora sp. CA-053990]|uniref:2-oxoglutarate dehydrogenase, E2 component, dihydrolipoamide succinyltransferase n=1 Tax=Actinomycetospora sp. CA-053990 TaxID=3239891 RepID=UPI003D8C357E